MTSSDSVVVALQELTLAALRSSAGATKCRLGHCGTASFAAILDHTAQADR
jgi:hypothetical protein